MNAPSPTLKARTQATLVARSARSGVLDQRSLVICAVSCALSLAAVTSGQQDNPVYVDDSPQARELLRQARDQTRENAGEAVRIYQQLLDEVSRRLTPVNDVSPDHFTSVRQRVLEALRTDAALLDRYRLVQTPVAEQLLQQGDAESLRRVALSYTLTEPGLESLLRMAQRDLESGRFHAALSWLAQAEAHPDFVGRRAAHTHYMAALAWHDLDRSDMVARHQQALMDIGFEGEVFEPQLRALLRGGELPAGVTRDAAVNMLTHAPVPALTDLVPQAIWSVPMEDSLIRRRFRAVNQGEPPDAGLPADALQERLSMGDMATAGVTIAGPVAYVNQGHTVLACDRLTGRELWRYQDFNRMESLDRDGIEALDLNLIAVAPEADCLVTLTGHAQANRRSDGGRVTALNISDQPPRRRWSTPLTGVVEAAPDEELFAHGAPVILEGTVYVMARKLSAQLLTAAYVVAIDLETGAVKWARHISSSGGLRVAPRPFDSLLLHEGALYLASPVGAMAKIDPATGETLWLQRFPVPISPPVMDQTRRPWEMTGPVMTSRGLLALQPDSRRVVLLDRETGDLIESHSAGSQGDWNAPRYLLSDDGAYVYAVGADVRCFNVENLESPAWTQPGLVTQSAVGDQRPGGEPKPADLESMELRGRVQVAGESLIVPTSDGVLVLDGVTGAVQQSLAIDAAGNPLALDSQLLMALGDRVDAYMSLSRAEQMLRSQMAQSPGDPDPALSLLRLGMRVGNVPLALEAAERALTAINARIGEAEIDSKRMTARAELFALLLEMARTLPGLTAEQGEAVFARLEQAASGEEQSVERLLAYGDWLAGRQTPSLTQAVEQWQTILSEPGLASAWRVEEGVMRPAYAAAVQRIATLMSKRGANVYAPQADFATVRLAQMPAMPGPEQALAVEQGVEGMLTLAREFPFADAALEAAVRAADAQEARNDTRGALASLITVHRLAPRPQSAARLLGRAARISEQNGWTQQAHDTLAAVIDEFGDIDLEPGAGLPKRRASEWLRARETDDPALVSRRPQLGLPTGEATALNAPMIAAARRVGGPVGAGAGVMPTDRTLLREGNAITLITSQNLEPVWSTTIEGASPQVLRSDDQGILLWFGADPQDPRAVMLNPEDGAVKWETPRLADLLADPVRDLNRIRAPREQMPNGESFDASQTIALVQQQAIILIRRTGAIMALSTTDGKTPLWGPRLSLEQVHLAEVRDGVLVLAGMARELEGGRPVNRDAADAQQSPGTLVPRILVLDPLTGRPSFAPDGIIRPSARAGVKWMNVSPLGVLVYGTSAGIDAVDLYNGRRAWLNGSYGALDTQQAWSIPPSTRRIVFQDQRSRLRSIDLASGAITEPFMQDPGGDWDASEFKSLMVDGANINRQVWGHYRQRIVRHDPRTGAVTGGDKVTDPQRDYRWAMVVESAPMGGGREPAGDNDRIIAVSVTSRQPQMPGGGGGRRTQYVYTVYLFSGNGKSLADPYETPPLPDRVQQVTAIDNWLLLSTLTSTVAVPMPVE